MKPVSILISNYNSFEAIQCCVESIRARTDYPRYRIIVHDDESPNGIDVPYLEEAEARGWLRLIRGDAKRKWRKAGGAYPPYVHRAPFWHGHALNKLINEACDTDLAVTLDCDVFILAGGEDWLRCLVDMVDARTLLVSSEGPAHRALSGLFVQGWYWMSFALLNMRAYHDGMEVDWMAGSAEREGQIEVWDPGSPLWVKVRRDNPQGYVVKPMPPSIEAKRHHVTQVSVRHDGTGSKPEKIAGEYFREKFMGPVIKELAVLRGSA